MVQAKEMTQEEKEAMYLKLSKSQLIKMLIAANNAIDTLTRNPSFAESSSIEVYVGDRVGQCPPMFGGCPMIFMYIAPGSSAKCSSCGRMCQSSSPVF